MHQLLNGIRQRFHQMNLSQWLILNLVLVVIAIIVLIGLPTNLAMWRALEGQVWLRVQDAQSATNGLYNAEVTRLKKLAGLIAGRPTLYNLIQQGDVAGMGPYLNSLKEESGNLDIVQIITPDMQAGDQLAGLPSPQEFLAGREPYSADFVTLCDPPSLFIVGISDAPQPLKRRGFLGYACV